MKPTLFSTEQLLRGEVSRSQARAASYSPNFRRNLGTKPLAPCGDGANVGKHAAIRGRVRK